MNAPALLLWAALAPHPFTVQDLVALDRVSDPQVSPTGDRVVFTVRTTDLEANRGRTDVWIVAVDGSGLRQLTTDPEQDFGARWLPDGRAIVFLSNRSGSSQVWELPLDGGEARQVTRLPLDVENLGVFPDGERLVFTMEVYPDADPAETARRDREREANPVKARIYDELLFRHWDTWEDGKRSHVFVGSRSDASAPVDLMKGWDADSPTKPYGGAEEIAVSPGGDAVVFAAKNVGREAAFSTNVDLWSVTPDGSSPPRNLTEDNAAYDNHPAFSRDGRFIAWTAMARAGFESDRLRVVLLDRASGAKRVLTEDWDRSAGSLAWSEDSKTIFTAADNLGNVSLFAVDATTGRVSMLVDKGTNTGPQPAGPRLVFSRDTLRSPADLFSVSLDGSDLRQVTSFNAQRLASIEWGDYEQFTFAGHGGETVHGYVMRPPRLEPGQKVPVAFLIHGGPQGSFGDHFSYRWNPEIFAGAGYGVVFIDFHGSVGYGQAFTDAISGDWGGKPYEDLMKGLDAALAKYEFLDGSRVCALGASYGGYMINWIAGQTDRFRCLVNHDGLFDTRMFYYDTEELWFPEWENDGPAYESPAGFDRFNPALHVARWKTPMLVVHGGRDYRIVESQGLGAFTALQRRDVPSKLLYFPDENHWVLKPRNSILWHETVLDWLERWTR